MKRFFIVALCLCFIVQPALPALAEEAGTTTALSAAPAEQPTGDQDQSYSAVMRRLQATRVNDLTRLPLSEQTKDAASLRAETVADLEALMSVETGRLQALDVPRAERKAYLSFLRQQLDSIDTRPANWLEKLGTIVTDILGLEDQSSVTLEDTTPRLRLPPHPGSFGFTDDHIMVTPISGMTVPVKTTEQPAQFLARLKHWRDRITLVETAQALDDQYLPTIDDVRSDVVINQAVDPNTTDAGEVIINSEISNLAATLEHNPVAIFNYMRNTILYEPYYGAKKGSSGCWREKRCNDVDAASLTIALMRASGIPARYHKGVAVMKVEQLKNLLGVDETRTAFLALGLGEVPIFSLIGGSLGMVSADQYDFSQETHLALEWTYPEVFLRYDERGGNYANILSFADATSTESVRAVLRSLSPSNSTYTKQQWIPMDTLIKSYVRTDRPILVDQSSANWNPATFFSTFLSTYTGALSPIQKYEQDILASTGQDVQNNLSGQNIAAKNYATLPSTLPYIIGSGTTGGGAVINQETWSKLPNERRHQITISLLREQNPTDVVLSNTFYGSAISSELIDLKYKGATPTDEQTIASYGGISETPATLVAITPYLESSAAGLTVATNNTVTIGEALLTRFVHSLPIRGTQSWRTNQSAQLEVSDKFSTGGNQEGMYLTLSRVEPDTTLDTDQKILISGPAALAREYLVHQQSASDLLAGSLNYQLHLSFSRAVVTQNRILNRVNGLPTTFDFKGFTIDAMAHIYDYSSVSRYDTHRETFRRLWAMELSNEEAKLFEDTTGLQSISSVKGLQYAYQNPQTYTVYTVASSTPNYQQLIDSLNLSQNTKTNLLNDIQNNNTVTVPNQPITLGAFTGILYISLAPNFTGTYAIGEQVGAKGGFSASPVTLYTYQSSPGNVSHYAGAPAANNTIFLYQDSVAFGNIACRPDTAWRTQMESRPDWIQAFGFACTSGSVQFGDKTQQYIVAGNATKFYRANAYDYWVSHAAIKTQVDQYLNAMQVGRQEQLRFSLVLGTYLLNYCRQVVNAFGITYCPDSMEAAAYYSPYQNGSDIGRVYHLEEGFLTKASADDARIIALLGFPTSDAARAADSSYGTQGIYQNFVNGQLYKYQRWGFDWIYYTDGKITERHNADGGTGGLLGFPENDPMRRNGYEYQEFEGQNEIGWNLSTNQTSVDPYKKYRCQLDPKWDNPAYLGFVIAHGVWDTGVKTVDDLGSLIGGVLSGLFHPSQTYAQAQTLVGEIKQIDKKQIRDFLIAVGGAAQTALISEYDTSLGPNGCEQRTAYLTGRIAGEILLIYVPLEKLTALEKVEAIRVAEKSTAGIKAIGLVGKWLEYRSDVSKIVDRIPSAIKLAFKDGGEDDGIIHIILGKFNKTTGRFQGKGLHSARTLEKGMEDGVLKAVDINNTSRVFNNFSDIPVDVNGVREAQILKTEGFEKKSFFPREWSDETVLDAIVEASQQSTGNTFSAVVTRNGRSVPIFGVLDNGKIKTAYPIFTP